MVPRRLGVRAELLRAARASTPREKSCAIELLVARDFDAGDRRQRVDHADADAVEAAAEVA